MDVEGIVGIAGWECSKLSYRVLRVHLQRDHTTLRSLHSFYHNVANEVMHADALGSAAGKKRAFEQ